MESGKYCLTMADILAAKERIADHAVVTPCIDSDNIGHMVNAQIYFKLETMQRCKAFKFRGALNKLRTIPEGSTVCAVSAGNHSQGVALAASLCNCKATIFMPENAPSAKVKATQHYGGTVIQTGATFDDAKNEMFKALEQHKDWIFVPPYNDREIIAGTGTIGLEIAQQIPKVQTVVVPIGGGGLISGIAYALKALKPKVRIIGVQMASCPATYKIYNQNKNKAIEGIRHETLTPLADGIAVKTPGNLNLAIINDLVDEIVIVSEDEVAEAVALLAERSKVISEGAGATPLAAVLSKKFKYQPNEVICCVVSGGNIPLRMLARCIDRALFLRQNRVSVSVIVPYGTSHFAKLVNVLAKQHAEIVSCMSAPHVDTVANQEQYTIIMDVDGPDHLNDIKTECESNGWYFEIQSCQAYGSD